MAEAIPWELRERAEELYIVDGYTLAQVATETGISVQALEKWSVVDGWVEKKKEYRQTLGEIKRNTVLLRKSLIQKALGSLDPQDIYAAVRLESVAMREKKKDEVQQDIDRPRLFLENLNFIASVLKEIDPEGLRVLAESFEEIVRRFKEAHAKAA